ncbi:MAG: lysophospholipid acyltransferase family protein [Candidatus Omnitrophica bacterium]|nr:lysophospholipid acyltransferase family protein [Candidatus Omnitrophota bacterium]
MQSKLKQVRDFLGRMILKFSLLIALLPSKVGIGFAYVIGKGAYLFLKGKRQITLRNLELAFGKEKSNAELRKIACQVSQEICRYWIEILQFLHFPSRFKIEIKGQKNLDMALSQGKGVILVSAHFGNFPLMIAVLTQKGYKIKTIMRHMHDLKSDKLFCQLRQKLNIRSIMLQSRQVSVSKCLNALRKNEVLLIQIDQHAGAGGIFVDFFGKPAATTSSPVIFALRTGAPILPVFILREAEVHNIIIEPNVGLYLGSNKEEIVKKTMSKLTKIVECYVKKHPEQWAWLHKRWKGEERVKGI